MGQSIAMLQSLVCDGEVKPFIKEYGLVIVDECHTSRLLDLSRCFGLCVHDMYMA